MSSEEISESKCFANAGWLFLLGLVLGLVYSVVVLSITPEMYESSSQVEFKFPGDKAKNVDQGAQETEAAIMSSQATLEVVFADLNLEDKWGMEMTAATHDLEPTGKPAPPESPWIAESEPSILELAVRSTVNNIQQPIRFAQILGEAAPPAIRAYLENAASGPEDDEDVPAEVPRTRFNGKVSPHRVFEASSFQLSDVKQIRKCVEGATVNDVILAVVGGALRRYLEHHLELPIESLSAFAPISTRTADQKGAAGNQVSGMFVAMHSDEPDPVRRLEKVYRTTTSSKEMTEAMGARSMTDVTQTMPGALAGIAGRLVARTGLMSRMKPIAHCVVTNVPGPQVPLYFTGAKLVGSFALGLPMEGIGLFHGILSYNGAITISVTACRQQMPDPSFYAECIEASFKELREAAVS